MFRIVIKNCSIWKAYLIIVSKTGKKIQHFMNKCISVLLKVYIKLDIIIQNLI